MHFHKPGVLAWPNLGQSRYQFRNLPSLLRCCCFHPVIPPGLGHLFLSLLPCTVLMIQNESRHAKRREALTPLDFRLVALVSMLGPMLADLAIGWTEYTLNMSVRLSKSATLPSKLTRLSQNNGTSGTIAVISAPEPSANAVQRLVPLRHACRCQWSQNVVPTRPYISWP